MAYYKFSTDSTKIPFIIDTDHVAVTDDQFYKRGESYKKFVDELLDGFQDYLSKNQLRQLKLLLKNLTVPFCNKDIDINLNLITKLAEIEGDRKSSLLIKTLSYIDQKYQSHKHEFKQNSQSL